MNRNDLQVLINSLTLIGANQDTLESYLADEFETLGMSPGSKPFVKASIKAITSGTRTYDFNSDMYKILTMFYNNVPISESTAKGLSAYTTLWPDDSGDPKAYTQDEITARDYTLYPNPSTTSDPLIPINGEPYGEDYPANSLVIFYSDNRESNILDIFSLGIAFAVSTKEFTYPSDHEDLEYSGICSDISKLCYALTGVR